MSDLELIDAAGQTGEGHGAGGGLGDGDRGESGEDSTASLRHLIQPFTSRRRPPAIPTTPDRHGTAGTCAQDRHRARLRHDHYDPAEHLIHARRGEGRQARRGAREGARRGVCIKVTEQLRCPTATGA